MIVLIYLIDQINNSIHKIGPKIKKKYFNIDWEVIEKRKYIDEKTGERWNSMNLGDIWLLANGIIKDELLDKLNELLEKEIPTYYIWRLPMSENLLVNDARVMSKGQVTIPKNIRAALGISVGDRVTFIVEDNSVRIMNSALYAMRKFQEQMNGQAAKAGLMSEDDVAEWITQSRREENAE